MKLKILLLTMLGLGLSAYFSSCDSSSYEIEEQAVNEDSVNAIRSAEIKQDIVQQTPEIKEETTQIRKRPQYKYTVQIGAYEIRSNAEAILNRARNMFGYDFQSRLIGGLYKIQTGSFDNQDDAMPILSEMKQAGFMDAFITEEGK